MPLIVQDDEPLDDDEDEFPSVESTLSDAPPLEVLRRNANTGHPGDFVGTTPPPFGGDSRTGSGPSLSSLPPQKRSILWPLVAVAAVAVAGAALFLVWRQMQNQGPPPVVNITASPSEPPPAVDPQVAVVTPDAAEASKPVDKPPVEKPITKVPPPKKSPYDVAIQQQRSKINACATEHGAPDGQARVVIEIATNGKAKTVSLEPAKLNTTPLGACIKNVLSGATFPTAKEEMKVAVALKAN